MFWILTALFIALPAAEIALFLSVGSRIGVLNTISLVLLTGVLGAWLARTQGIAVLGRIQQTLARGELPSDELVHGAAVLVGGALLLTPGFLTDLLGLLLLLPPTRAALALIVLGAVRRSMQDGSLRFGGFSMSTGPVMPGEARHERRVDPNAPAPDDGRMVDAEFHAPAGPVQEGDVSRPTPGARVVDAQFRPIDEE